MFYNCFIYLLNTLNHYVKYDGVIQMKRTEDINFWRFDFGNLQLHRVPLSIIKCIQMIYMYFLLSLFVFLQQVEHQQKEEMEFDLMMIPIRSPDNTHQKKINQKLVLKSDLPLIPNCAK